MALNHLMGYARFTVNGQPDESLGKGTLQELILRLMAKTRSVDSSSFSSITFQFSRTELKTALTTQTSHSDINALVLLGLNGLSLSAPTDEEQAAIDAADRRASDSRYTIWSRASTQSDSFRNSLMPSEWDSIRQWAKDAHPKEYAARKHWFGG